MADTSNIPDNFTPIVGLPVQEFVSKQVDARQRLLGKKNLNSNEINYINANSAWIKMASSIYITKELLKEINEKGVIQATKTRLANLDLDEKWLGTALAEEFVLFNGVGMEGDKAGVRTCAKRTTNDVVFCNYAVRNC